MLNVHTILKRQRTPNEQTRSSLNTYNTQLVESNEVTQYNIRFLNTRTTAILQELVNTNRRLCFSHLRDLRFYFILHQFLSHVF